MASQRIDLASAEVEEARRLAEATYQRFRSEPGHYRNLPRSHFIGKLAEVAVEKWLRSEGLIVIRRSAIQIVLARLTF